VTRLLTRLLVLVALANCAPTPAIAPHAASTPSSTVSAPASSAPVASAESTPGFLEWVDGGAAFGVWTESGAIEVWNTADRTLRARCDRCRIENAGVTWPRPWLSPDGTIVALTRIRYLAGDFYSKELAITEVVSAKTIALVRWPDGPRPDGFKVAWSPDGTRAIVTAASNYITSAHAPPDAELYDAKTWQRIAVLTSADGRRRLFSFSADGKRILVEEGSIELGDYSVAPAGEIDATTGTFMGTTRKTPR
jgi:hypothetical protein